MIRPRWGPEEDEGGGGPGGGGTGLGAAGGGPGGGQRSWAAVAASRGGNGGGETADDRKKRAAKQKKLFQIKLELEGNRKTLGKGKIFTLMKDKVGNAEPELIRQSDIGRVLVLAQISKDQVIGIKSNDFRMGQVEVLLKDDFNLDINKIQKVIDEKSMHISVGDFENSEEVFMVYGLPLTNDLEGMKECIKEAVAPFVRKVVSIDPSKFFDAGTTDYFKGKLNGNWRVVVEPKREVGVPNFIVVDQYLKVQAQVTYRKKFHVRPEMCSDCFTEGHFKRSPECKGVRDWNDYCAEFIERWNSESDKEVEEVVGNTSTSYNRLEAARHSLRNEKKKSKELEQKHANYKEGMESKVKELEEKVRTLEKDKDDALEKVDSLSEEVEEYSNQNRSMAERMGDYISTTESLEGVMGQVKDHIGNLMDSPLRLLSSTENSVERMEDSVEQTEGSVEPMDDSVETTEASVGPAGGPVGPAEGSVGPTGDPVGLAEGSVEPTEKGVDIPCEGGTTDVVPLAPSLDNLPPEKVSILDLPLENLPPQVGAGAPVGILTPKESSLEEEGSGKTTPHVTDKRKDVISPLEGDNKRTKTLIMPSKGMEVWVWEGDEKVRYSVKSKKDNLPNGGCYNCVSLAGERKNINFNKVRWVEFVTSKEDHLMDFNISEGGTEAGDEGAVENTTPPPPPLPPRPKGRNANPGNI